MTEYVLSALAGLFSLQSVVGFCIGVVSTMAFYLFEDQLSRKYYKGVYNRRREDKSVPRGLPDRRIRENESKISQIVSHPLLVLWTLLFVLAGFLGFQQYTTTKSVNALAIETRACQVDFNKTLTERIQFNLENDTLNRDLLINLEGYLHERLYPPEEIKFLQLNDPTWSSNSQFLQWEMEVNRHFYEEIKHLYDKKIKIEERRALIPFPRPECGNES